MEEKVNQIEQSAQWTIDPIAFAFVPKSFAQLTIVNRGQNEVQIVFGAQAPFNMVGPMGQTTIFSPTAVCYFTPNHFREFVRSLNEQIAEMDKENAEKT